MSLLDRGSAQGSTITSPMGAPAGSSTIALSSLTAATAANTIDSLNFAQVWNWSTITSQAALKLATVNTSFTGKLLELSSTGNNAGNTGTLLTLTAAPGAGIVIPLNIQQPSGSTGAKGINIDMNGGSGTRVGLTITTTGAASTSKGIFLSHTDVNEGGVKAIDIAMVGTNGGQQGVSVALNNTTGSGTCVVAINASTSAGSFAIDSYVAGAGTKQGILVRNSSTAANNNGASVSYYANRTTSGYTNVGYIAGLITDITDVAYKGALVFATASNATPTEKLRIDDLGQVIFGSGIPGVIKTTDDASPQNLLISTGQVSGGHGSAALLIRTANSGSTSAASGSISIISGSGAPSGTVTVSTGSGNGGNSAALFLNTGDADGSTGDIIVTIGANSSGSKGKIKLVDGSEGGASAGWVWTLTGTDGAGTWQAASSGGATTTLNNLGTTNINASLLFDTDNTYSVGSITKGVNHLYVYSISAPNTGGLVIATKDQTGGTNSGDITLSPGSVAAGTRGDVVSSANLKIVDGHLRTNFSTGATVAATAAAGLLASATLSTNANDIAGTVSITCGTGSSAGNAAEITFNIPYAVAPIVVITPADQFTAGAMGTNDTVEYYANADTAKIYIGFSQGGQSASTYVFNYHCIEVI